MIHLAMFAKYWESGQVKTRLAATIGVEVAQMVYLAFVQHLVTKFAAFGNCRTLVFSPSDSRHKFREQFSSQWNLYPQTDGNLGIRMRSFFETFTKTADDKNILIGSDAPDLPIEILSMAVNLLDEAPVVIGPSTDGGYYLLAIKGHPIDMFSDVSWSTERVLSETIARLKQQDVVYRLLPEWSDVDEADDLANLIHRLRKSGSDSELLEKLTAMELPGVC